MTKSPFGAAAALLAILASLLPMPVPAMTITEFRKFSRTDQSTYIGAAVSMLAYSLAANGDTAGATCVKNWYFSARKGVETPGPHEISVEMALAEKADATKYHVEGVILGTAQKACPVVTKPRP